NYILVGLDRVVGSGLPVPRSTAMKRWGHFLLAVLAVPLLVITDAELQPGAEQRGAERRRNAVVRTLQWLFRIYIIACIVGFLWQKPAAKWPGNNGFGPFLDPVIAVHEWFAVAEAPNLSATLVVVNRLAANEQPILLLRCL